MPLKWIRKGGSINPLCIPQDQTWVIKCLVKSRLNIASSYFIVRLGRWDRSYSDSLWQIKTFFLVQRYHNSLYIPQMEMVLFKQIFPFYIFKINRNIQSLSLMLSKIHYQYFSSMLFKNTHDLANRSWK